MRELIIDIVNTGRFVGHTAYRSERITSPTR